MITLTELAAREVKTIITQQNEAAQKDGGDVKALFLRVGVKGGGCSGFSYSLDLTESKTDMDEAEVMHGVEVICDSKSLIYLDGTTVDLTGTLVLAMELPDPTFRFDISGNSYIDSMFLTGGDAFGEPARDGVRDCNLEPVPG